MLGQALAIRVKRWPGNAHSHFLNTHAAYITYAGTMTLVIGRIRRTTVVDIVQKAWAMMASVTIIR